MNDRNKKCGKAVEDARLLKKHINLALKRKDGLANDFIDRLMRAYNIKVEQINNLTRIGIVLVSVSVLSLAGCYENTRIGFSKDLINHESVNIQNIEPKLYRVNQRVLPARMNQIEETLTWQEKIKARIIANRKD